MDRQRVFSNIKAGLQRGFTGAQNLVKNLPGFARNLLVTADNTAKTLASARDTANKVYNVAKSNNLIKPSEALDRGVNSVNQKIDEATQFNKNLQNAGTQLF